MLKGIPAIIGPDLLHILHSMGHGDDIVIADANFPAASAGPNLVRMDGHTATDVLDAVLSLMPLDDFGEFAAQRMQVVDDPDRIEPITGDFLAILQKHEPAAGLGSLERFAFYERAAGAFAVVQTGERRLYGNIILKKGVVRADEDAG